VRRLFLKRRPGAGFDVCEADDGGTRVLAEGVSVAVLVAFFAESAPLVVDTTRRAYGGLFNLGRAAASLLGR
jgi:hypothetical protein